MSTIKTKKNLKLLPVYNSNNKVSQANICTRVGSFLVRFFVISSFSIGLITVCVIVPSAHSAGVGRTGTFIAIDVALKQIDGESTLDVFNYVRLMRFRRNYMVQTGVSVDRK